MWELSVLAPQFVCKSTTALKNKAYLKKNFFLMTKKANAANMSVFSKL